MPGVWFHQMADGHHPVIVDCGGGLATTELCSGMSSPLHLVQDESALRVGSATHFKDYMETCSHLRILCCLSPYDVISDAILVDLNMQAASNSQVSSSLLSHLQG